VAHLNRQIDGTPRPANTNVPTAAPSSLGALRTGAAALGVTVGVSQLTGMADEYTNITNRLRLMAPDQAKANALFEQLHGVANRTRSELGATVDAFAGMSRATKALGLSQDETVRLTETLNKLVTVSGKSATESAAGLMQFSQALSSGRLQGDELRSVFENMPSLVDALMKSLGKTQAELREMGSQGLITSKVMVTALQQAAAGVDASMGKTIPTLAQSWVVFKNDMMATVGEMNQSLGITSALGSAMGALGTAIQLALTPFRLLGEAFDAIGISGGMVVKTMGSAGIAARALAGTGFGPIGVAVAAAIPLLAEYTTTFDEATGIIGEYTAEGMRARQATFDLYMSIAQGKTTLAEVVRDQTAHNLQTALGAEVANAFRDATASLTPEIENNVAAAKAMADAYNAVGDAFGTANYALGKLGEAVGDSVFVRALGMGQDRARAVREATRDLEALNEVYKSGTLPVELYRQKKQQLEGVIYGNAKATREAASEAKKLHNEYEKLRRDIFGESAKRPGRQHMEGEFYKADFQREVDAEIAAEQSAMKSYMDSLSARQKAHENWQSAVTKATDEAAEKRRKAEEDLAEASRKAAQETTDAWAQGLTTIGSSFIDAALAGKKSFAEMTQSMLRDIAVLILKMAALEAIKGGALGSPTGLAAKVATGLLGGANGFDYVANSNRLQLPGFAGGGSFRVDGTGGTDSKIAMFRVTPGESVHVRTPQQQMMQSQYVQQLVAAAQAGGSGGGDRTLVLVQSSDPGEVTAAMGTNEGEKVYARNQRKYGRRRLG
jgi:tape measure domain-containing protein